MPSLSAFAQRVLHLALGVHVARFLEVRPDGFRLRHAQRRGPPGFVRHRDGGELVLLHDAEADAGVGLDLLLEVLGELLVALGGDDGQRVDVEAAQPFALLVDAQPQAAPDGLAAFPLGAHLAEGANLEDVRVVPALAQRRVGEDELQLGLEAQQLLLVPHDQVVGAFGVVAVALVVLGGVRSKCLSCRWRNSRRGLRRRRTPGRSP